MSTPSNGSDSDASSINRKRGFSIPVDEEIEPYVRRRRMSSERNRKRLEKLSEEEQNVLRTSINSRERRRMHDLNDALDELRSVLPYSHGVTARRLSKINTIILASNCIRNLNKRFNDITAENEQLRTMIPEEKLSAIKLPPLQLAAITTLPSAITENIGATKRSIHSLSSTPPKHSVKPDTPPSTKNTDNTSQQSSRPQQPTSAFPMALFAAAALNYQHQNPSFVPQSQVCMKRFNPSALCLCVGCLMMQNGAGLIGRSIHSNSSR